MFEDHISNDRRFRMANRDYKRLRLQIRDVHQALHVLRQNPGHARAYDGLERCLELRLTALEEAKHSIRR